MRTWILMLTMALVVKAAAEEGRLFVSFVKSTTMQEYVVYRENT